MSHHQAILFWSVQLPSIRKSTQCKQLHDHQLLIKNFGHYLFISIHLEKLHNIDKFSCHWSLSLFYFLSFSEGCCCLRYSKKLRVQLMWKLLKDTMSLLCSDKVLQYLYAYHEVFLFVVLYLPQLFCPFLKNWSWIF